MGRRRRRTSHSETPKPSWVQALAARIDSRAAPSAPATQDIRPTRSGAITVTFAPAGASSLKHHRGDLPLAGALGGSRPRSGARVRARARPVSRARTVAASVVTRCARQLLQATGGRGTRVGLGQHLEQVEDGTVGNPLGHDVDGHRVLHVPRGAHLGEQQVPADQRPDRVRVGRREAHPCRHRSGDRCAGHGVVDRPALADVVQQCRDEQQIRALHPPDQAGRLDAGLDHVPVDRETVHGRGVPQQAHPRPLREQVLDRARSRRGSPRRRAVPDRTREAAPAASAPRPATDRASAPSAWRAAPPTPGRAPGRARRPRPRPAA